MANHINDKELTEAYKKKALETWSPANWRSWGSWWGWGTPTGLGLFFVLIAIAVWILFQL